MPRPSTKGVASAAPAPVAVAHGTTQPLVLNSTTLPLSGNTLLSVSISPTAGETSDRRPADIVCVVDISGSMDRVASEPDEHGECDNLTRLDLVKHSVRTVIAMMKPNDRFGLVTFSSKSESLLGLTQMNEEGRAKATSIVESLRTQGTTNLWAGLSDGLKMAKGGAVDGKVQRVATNAVMLLTDGEPNEVIGLDKVVAEYPNCMSMVSTFGFGYSLKTPLLVDIATKFDGTFTFIPDASFVGTAFVNNTASIMSTVAQNCMLTVDVKKGGEIVGVAGSFIGQHKVSKGTYTKPTKGIGKNVTAQLGPCMFGQARSVCIELSGLTGLVEIVYTGTSQKSYKTKDTYSASFNGAADGADGAAGGGGAAAATTVGNPTEAVVQNLRLATATLLAAAADKANSAAGKVSIEKAIADIEASSAEVAADPRVVALLADLKGQATEAVSKDEWFTKWGQHYLPSLARSHMLQQCTNFKDPGLQVYGLGAVFQATRDEGDDVFVALPPPTPTVFGPSYGGYGGSASRSAPSAPIDMSRYYNASGGCFKAGGAVMMADGTTKLVENVRQGDLIQTAGATAAGETAAAAVVCTVKTRCPAGIAPLVTLGGGKGPTLTQYHPVRTLSSKSGGSAGGAWAFPGDLAATTMQKADYVYTYLLEKGAPSVHIDGVECVTLGHGLDEDVVRHKYLGSHAAVKSDLEMCPGWQNGLVELEPESFVRAEGATGQICAIRHVDSRETATTTAAAATTVTTTTTTSVDRHNTAKLLFPVFTH